MKNNNNIRIYTNSYTSNCKEVLLPKIAIEVASPTFFSKLFHQNGKFEIEFLIHDIFFSLSLTESIELARKILRCLNIAILLSAIKIIEICSEIITMLAYWTYFWSIFSWMTLIEMVTLFFFLMFQLKKCKSQHMTNLIKSFLVFTFHLAIFSGKKCLRQKEKKTEKWCSCSMNSIISRSCMLYTFQKIHVY